MQNPTTRKRSWSQLAFDFIVKFNDGVTDDLEVRSSVADAIRWEKNNNGKSFIEDTPSTTSLVWLAWAAAKRQGLTELDFDLFCTRIADFATDPIAWDGRDGLDPTQPAPSPDSSPN